MRIFLLVLIMSMTALAKTRAPVEPQHWGAAIEIIDKHEFYEEGKPILSPAETWQTLFSVTYVTQDLKKIKDCVMYRVPGHAAPGVLKIASVALTQDCGKKYFEPGDREITDVKELAFKFSTDGVVLSFSLPRYVELKWDISLIHPKLNEPKMQMSSAEYKAGKVILLASSKKHFDKGDSIEGKCHDIDDLCQEISPSRCSLCPEGWYEIPNGCPTGPKFCGIDRCGGKDRPACRRGTQEPRTECRIDSSFAYCHPGLTVQCEGSLAYCR